MKFRSLLIAALICLSIAGVANAQYDPDPLCKLTDGKTKQVNALWGENPPDMRIGNGRTRVVIANLKGPGIITMIHFALPERMSITRDVVLRIYWDGEKTPSVESPLADFFCDPNGALERVDSIFVNKMRGWNCYFPMPFRKSAKVEVTLDSRRYPSGDRTAAPCYSYVHYRTLKSVPTDFGYFHANWKQQTLLLGKQEYKVFEAKGRGQFVGWNISIHSPDSQKGYPVDENEMFYIDGEPNYSIEWQGLEDSFGFSWGFPRVANCFPYMGYQPYYNGAAAYRFNDSDRISFNKSLKMTVGFGKGEIRFREEYSNPENPLEISSVAYWYQKEPHVPFAPMLPPDKRAPALAPAPDSTAARKYLDAGETLVLNCGRVRNDVEFLDRGWDFTFDKGFPFAGWTTPVNHCWADGDSLKFTLTCPKGVSGTLKLYIIDGDNFGGGRSESISVAGKKIGDFDSFQSGRWIDVPISSFDTAQGRIPVVAKNLKPGSNAVISIVKFVSNKS